MPEHESSTALKGWPHRTTDRRTSGREGAAVRRTRTASARLRCLSVEAVSRHSTDDKQTNKQTNKQTRHRRKLLYGRACGEDLPSVVHLRNSNREGQPTAGEHCSAAARRTYFSHEAAANHQQDARRYRGTAGQGRKAGSKGERSRATIHVQRAPYTLLLILGMM